MSVSKVYLKRWRFVLELFYFSLLLDRDDWVVRRTAGVPKAERVRGE